MKRVLVVLLVASLVSLPAKAEPSREFLMSCIYGTLAGTLVGAASLATAERPSDHLQRIARGASLGFYTGILLGLYVVYGVPDESDELNEVLSKRLKTPPPMIYPIVDENMKFEGVQLSMTILSF